MTITRKYYEELLDLLERLTTTNINSDFAFSKIKGELHLHLTKIQQYHLFDLEEDSKLLNLLSEESEDKYYVRIDLAHELFKFFLETKIDCDHFSKDEPNYLKSIELSLSNLTFEEYWEIYKPIYEVYSEYTVFKIHSKKFKYYNSVQNNYDNYKKELRQNKDKTRKRIKLKPLSKTYVKKITKYFEEIIEEYKDYVFNHYPSIKDEFKYYNSYVRIYFTKYMDKGAFMRIYIYKNPISESRVFVYPKSLDFIPNEFNNIEETEQEAFGGLSTYVKFDQDFENIIGRRIFIRQHEIILELLDIYIRNSSAVEKNELFRFLLKCEGYKIQSDSNKNIDFVASRSDEIKNYKWVSEKMLKLETLLKEHKKINDPNVTYLYSNRMLHSVSQQLSKEKINHISLYGIAGSAIMRNNGDVIHWYIKSKLKSLIISKSDSHFKADILISRLKSCKPGKKSWSEYENLCTDIFQFLFHDSFRKYTTKTQAYTHDGIFRRDLIINNNYIDSTSIWSHAKSDYASNVIIIDFKNYSNPLEQNEYYLPSKYLNDVTGTFGIVICREGINDSAKKLQRRMINKNELLLVLDDSDLMEMIREKAMGNEVTYFLENKKFLLYENE